MSNEQTPDHVRATADIEFGEPGRGVYAFRAGDLVPVALVEEHGWQEHVEQPKASSSKKTTGSDKATAGIDKTDGK